MAQKQEVGEVAQAHGEHRQGAHREDEGPPRQRKGQFAAHVAAHGHGDAQQQPPDRGAHEARRDKDAVGEGALIADGVQQREEAQRNDPQRRQMHPERGGHLAGDARAQEVAQHRHGEQPDVHEAARAQTEHVDAEVDLAHQALGVGRQACARHRNHHQAHGRDEVRGRDHLELELVEREEPKEDDVARKERPRGARPPQRAHADRIDAANAPLARHHQHGDGEGGVKAPFDGVRHRLKHAPREHEDARQARQAQHDHHDDGQIVQNVGDDLPGGAGKKKPCGQTGHRGAHDGGKPARRHGLDEVLHDERDVSMNERNRSDGRRGLPQAGCSSFSSSSSLPSPRQSMTPSRITSSSRPCSAKTRAARCARKQ